MAKLKTIPKQQRAAPSGLVSAMIGKGGDLKRNEGHSLPLVNMRSDPKTGSAVFGLDIQSAPVPQRRYTADLCFVTSNEFDIKLLFGQRMLFDEGPLDSALIIRMNPASIRDLVASVERMGSPNLSDISARLALPNEVLGEIKVAPKQTVTVVANLVAIGISGYETCLDFYHASAFAIRAASESNGLDVEPVVRVDLRTSSFIPLIEELKKAVSSFNITI